jgi:hypothetical protein
MIVLACLAISWIAVIAPLKSLVEDYRSRLANGQQALDRLKAVVSAGQVSDFSLDKTLSQFSADYLVGEQEPVMLAELQSKLRAIAIDRAAEVNSTAGLPSKNRDGYVFIGVRMSLRAQMENIQQILHTIEEGVPLLFIERVQLRLDGQPMPSVDPGFRGAPAIIAEIDVFGPKFPSNFKSLADRKP